MTTTADTSYALRDDWQDAWKPMIDSVGQDFSGGVTNTGIDEIEVGAVRKFCEPLEFSCPLHYDEAVARQHGYKHILAPVSGISQTWTHLGLWKPGMPTRYPNAEPNWDNNTRNMGATGNAPTPPFPPTTASFATDVEIEYFEPAVVGDRLSISGNKLLSVNPRETSVGRGAFMISEREVHNQRNELVAQIRSGSYRYIPFERKSDGGGSSKAAGPAGPIMSAIPSKEPLPEEREVDWSQQRYWDDVQEGEEIPPLAFHMTVFRLVVEAGANRDFNQIHHNTPVTQATGAPDMYANNVFIQAMWERAAREYIGVAGRFKKTGPFRMKIFNNVGESVITRGVVKRKWEENGEHLIEIEMRSEHSRGVAVGPAPVVASLPRRP